MENELFKFVQFLLTKTYSKGLTLLHNKTEVTKAFEKTLKDVRYHYPEIKNEELLNKIITNQNELAVFLYRIGNIVFNKKSKDEILLNELHWVLKEVCSCEIYFSSNIDEGFYIYHGEGTVIGSRNKIGKGLRIYQNVTIGQKKKYTAGAILGDNCRLYAGSKIIGEIELGNDVIIGSNTIISKNIPSNNLVYGNPNKIIELNNSLKSSLL